MYRKMLIAVDGTDTSAHALNQALNLARSEESAVVLAACIPGYAGDLRILGDKGALAEMRRPYEQALERARETAREQGVRAEAQMLEGDPVEELLGLAERSGADLMALGKRGNYYSDLVPIGSVAAKVIRLAESDVLLVPNHKELGLERIMAPVDGSPASLKAAERAMELAGRYGARLYLPTVYELPLEGFVQSPDMDEQFFKQTEAFQKPLVEKAGARGVRDVQARIVQGAPAFKILLEIIRQEDAGLVVMGASGHGRFSRLLLGSVAECVIGSGAAPVLLARTR